MPQNYEKIEQSTLLNIGKNAEIFELFMRKYSKLGGLNLNFNSNVARQRRQNVNSVPTSIGRCSSTDKIFNVNGKHINIFYDCNANWVLGRLRGTIFNIHFCHGTHDKILFKLLC